MMPNGSPLPIEYPKVTIGGLTLELKKSFLAEFMLDQAGVDVKRAAASFADGTPGRVAFITQMLAACCAHQYVARHETPPTAEQWAARISEEPDPNETFRRVAKAVFECISKAQPAAVPGQAPAAMTGQPN
jgi:hypothetical protein